MTSPATIWAFDLGKGSLGEAVLNLETHQFHHKATLLLPADLAQRGPASQAGTPASRYRAWKVRLAHRERERWLDTVWQAAGLEVLQPRQTALVCALPPKRDDTGQPLFDQGHWALVGRADYRLEREFAPALGEKTKDGAPSDAAGANLCYTSCLLRIKLLRWKRGDPPLEEWQVYKALRSAMQKRGYGRVPWAVKEARAQGKTPEELEAEDQKQLEQADPRYREAAGKWPEFKRAVPAEFHFPCYYDAFHMGLWSPDQPDQLRLRPDHRAASTRNVRFDRADVRKELIALGNNAAAMLPQLQQAFERWQRDGWTFRHPVTGEALTKPVHARTFGEFLCDGPAGQPDETSFEAFLNQRRAAGIRIGTFEEWMAALGQKTPRFDNRILAPCVLIPRYHACKVDARLEKDRAGRLTGKLVPDSLLATEVTFLLKLKNLLVADPVKGQRKLTVQEVRDIFAFAQRRLKSLPLFTPEGEPAKEWPRKVANCFAINPSDWPKIAVETECLKGLARLTVSDNGAPRPLTREEAEALLHAVAGGRRAAQTVLPAHLLPLVKRAAAAWKQAKQQAEEIMLRPLPGHEEVKAPRTSGRSAYSRVALRILKELILSGDAPSAFHARLVRREPDLLQRLGPAPGQPLAIFDDSTASNEAQRKQEDAENRKRGLLVSELNFLLQMRKDDGSPDSWENLFIPAQTLEALQQRHTEDGRLDADAAVRELLGTIKDPVVRHRLSVFDERLRKLRFGDAREGLPGFGVPEAIVLEFVREDFMGEEAKRRLQTFQRQREEERKKARSIGAESALSALKCQLWEAQGGECLNGREVLDQTGQSKARCLYRQTPLPLSRLDEYVIDHIVPRARGGPDAMVNYVLTTAETNEAKGDRTPFEWLHGSPDWDAYVARVKARAAALRNKKVQLLTREDAPELVERYTALAESAWISKLAQTIVNLRFGWRNGVDYSGPQPVKRVIVVSGGLTARVRAKYGLDKLLYGENTAPEVLAKKVKNRDDDRHHALDAMVMTFIPHWARDPNKQGFFRFPPAFRDANGREDDQRIRSLFASHLQQIVPRHLAYEPSVLADTIYGGRLDNGRPVIVQRVPVRELAYKQEQQRPVFNLTYAKDQIAHVRDPRLRRVLEAFVATGPHQAAWDNYCRALAAGTCPELPGRKVLKVTLNRDEDPAEFKDLSKDRPMNGRKKHRGAFRTRKGEHRGQFVYLDARGRARVRPVRPFESLVAVKAEVERLAAGGRVVGFFQSMCLVELDQPVTHGNFELQPGTYRLNTIKKDGRAQVTTAAGEKTPEINLAKLLAAGFRRIA
jgi:5-methylcytosine-specific restriction endonuclease McrA